MSMPSANMSVSISDAVADTAPAVRGTMNDLPGFKDTGKRMLDTWSEGVNFLRESRMYALTARGESHVLKGHDRGTGAPFRVGVACRKWLKIKMGFRSP